MKYIVVFVLLFISSFLHCQTFADINAGLQNLMSGATAWGDYDNDGDLDILIAGSAYRDEFGCLHNYTRIYRNDGNEFVDINALIEGVGWGSSLDWGDYDNDGDLDILLTGVTGMNYDVSTISKIYRNDDGTFIDINASLLAVTESSVDWGDYDNDGDLDILLTGYHYDGSEYDISNIYRNDSGVFTDINAGLSGVRYSSVAWGDYDNDGDLDIILAGSSDSGLTSKIYRNDSGMFTNIYAGLTGVSSGSVAWGDYDNDGDLDILLTGSTGSSYISKIYRNDSGVFIDINAGLSGTKDGSVDWGDYDNDGDLDILITGSVSKIYRNDSGAFTDISAGLTGVEFSSVAWGDYDNDGDLDILMSGADSLYTWVDPDGFHKRYYPTTLVFSNSCMISNTSPTSPTSLSTLSTGSNVTFTWDKSTDNETPQDGLSYNIYIGMSSMNEEINPSMSDINTGYRKVVKVGNTENNTTWTIKDLQEGTYYWSVQSIDNSFSGSNFSPERMFYIGSMYHPGNVVITPSLTDIELTWSEVSGASSYKVFASDLPYSGFIDVTSEGTFNGLSWIVPLNTASKRFYYIVAVDNTK